MKKAWPTILIGFLAITLLDCLGSLASRQMSFNYSYLLPFSFIIYIIIPFFITRLTDRKTAIVSAGLLGLFDATIGWKISIILKANTGNIKVQMTPPIVITTIIIVTITAMLLGLLGTWISTRIPISKKR